MRRQAETLRRIHGGRDMTRNPALVWLIGPIAASHSGLPIMAFLAVRMIAARLLCVLTGPVGTDCRLRGTGVCNVNVAVGYGVTSIVDRRHRFGVPGLFAVRGTLRSAGIDRPYRHLLLNMRQKP